MNVKQNIIKYLAAHRKMTLATSSIDGYPAAATVEYITEGSTIYFGTGKNSNKAQNILQNPKVAFAVDEDYNDWQKIQGVQIQGVASFLTDLDEIKKAGEMFGKKFPQMADIPVSSESVFIKIEAKTGYFIDYTKGWAHREETNLAA